MRGTVQKKIKGELLEFLGLWRKTPLLNQNVLEDDNIIDGVIREEKGGDWGEEIR